MLPTLALTPPIDLVCCVVVCCWRALFFFVFVFSLHRSPIEGWARCQQRGSLVCLPACLADATQDRQGEEAEERNMSSVKGGAAVLLCGLACGIARDLHNTRLVVAPIL